MKTKNRVSSGNGIKLLVSAGLIGFGGYIAAENVSQVYNWAKRGTLNDLVVARATSEVGTSGLLTFIGVVKAGEAIGRLRRR